MLLAVAVVGVLLGGCGGGNSDEPTAAVGPQTKAEKRAEAQAPKGASTLLRAIYRQFPAPKPDPEVRGSATAIKAGEAACKGKSPLQVREEFIGRSDLNEEQRRAVAKLEQYEKHPSYSFPAGQLAATVYEGTLPKTALSHYGYQGCVYVLALGLKARLARR